VTLKPATLHAPSIFDLNLNDLYQLFESWGEPPYRAMQVWEALYQGYVQEPDSISTLPLQMRRCLAENFSFLTIEPINQSSSGDGKTIKYLFRMAGGNEIETVLMSYSRRRTLCISSQAGCAMGCQFCATGQMGFMRNLTSGEILAQVIFFSRLLRDQGEKLTNVVVMGMGEPFHNYEATLEAIDRLNHPKGFNFGERRFTISTVGIVPKIRRFTREHHQINLAVSLHAADNELRSQLLPVNNKYPLDELLEACRDYVDNTHRRITFEWALILDVNDTPQQAKLLASRLKGLLCHVNVIPLNPTARFHGRSTTYERAVDFKDILERIGIPCTIRVRRGIDIQAGCGQLAIQNKNVPNPRN
jgi:23S rRNA (adenine2503-C2)-methyltransferase